MPTIGDRDLSEAELAELLADQVQVSGDGSTVWVHQLDGTTVGRFSKAWGLDVHANFEQMASSGVQCLHCTHEPAGAADWDLFCDLMERHHGIAVRRDLLTFSQAAARDGT